MRASHLGRRSAAYAVDGAIWVGPALVVWRRRGTPRPPTEQSWRWEMTMRVLKAAYAVIPTVLWGGTPGVLLLDLRVVDRATGATPGWAQAVRRWAAVALPGLAVTAFTRRLAPHSADAVARYEQLGRDSVRLREDHADDPVALERAIATLDLDHLLGGSVKLVAPIALAMAYWLVSVGLAVLDEQGRTIHDRIAGTVVVRSIAAR